MNLVHLIFGQVTFMVNFYADQFLEQDRAAMVSAPDFSANFNLPTPEEEFDFIVVGGGTAGCLVANRLARADAGFRVLLLEAGGDPPPPTFVPGNAVQWSKFEQIMFQQSTLPQQFPNASGTRVLGAGVGRVLGGTSVLNYMFFNRGSPYDYDNWANITGDSSWAYANLLKHFKAVESYAGQHSSDQHGSTGEITITTQEFAPGVERFLRAGAELGYADDVDPNGPQRLSFTRIDVNKRAGQRMSSYEAFLAHQAADLPNLEIRRYAQVDRVLFDETSRTAIGVSYVRHGFPFLAYASKEIVLSAGSYGSAQILLKSGVGPAEALRQLGIEPVLDLPVGLRNFQDHPIIPLVFQLPDEAEVYTPEQNLTMDSMKEFLDGSGGPLTSVEGLSAQAFIATKFAAIEGYPDWSDLQLALYSKNRGTLPDPAPDVHRRLVYCFIYLGRPKSRGSVRLNPDAVDGPLLIDSNMLAEPVDVDMFVDGIHMVLKVFENTTAYGMYGAEYPSVPLEECKHLAFRSADYWKCYVSYTVGSGSHPSGTCSMGRMGDKQAVVDSELEVIGAKNLRVIDASVMPVITNANIQAAVYVIAEKGAADILATHGVAPNNAENGKIFKWGLFACAVSTLLSFLVSISMTRPGLN